MEVAAETSACRVCDWLCSNVKETAGLSSISGDDSKLLPVISLVSGDKWGRGWLRDSSDFSATSIISSSWLFLASGLLWSFVSGDDPRPPLSLDGVRAASLNTGEKSDLSCTRGLSLSLGGGDEAVAPS